MDRVDYLLIFGAGYIAVVALVRLMAARRDEVIRQFRAEINRRRADKDAEEEDERDAA